MAILIRLYIETDASVKIETDEKIHNYFAVPMGGGHPVISYQTPGEYIRKLYGRKVLGIEIEEDTLSVLTEDGAITICASYMDKDVKWKKK